MRLLFPLVACMALVACSDAERDAAADADGNGSMSAETAGGAESEAPAAIECARASGQAEQAVCADKELIVIDRAMAEMPGYSVDAAWVAKRGECSRSDDLRHCLLDLYVSRIADLADSGMKEGGIIVGPVNLRCGSEEATALFVNSDPGAVHLQLGERRLTLPHVPAASGAKYEGRQEGEPWSFWSKGKESLLVRAGIETQCQELGRLDG
jgi:membrane-bound inhibitor of C-type lysozyme